MDTIELGDVAKDNITGFTGVLVAKTIWLHGCVRLTLQPQTLNKDGKVIESDTFDEQRVVLVKKVKAAGTVDTGGPRPAPTRERTPKR